jgi:hypothetical protein
MSDNEGDAEEVTTKKKKGGTKRKGDGDGGVKIKRPLSAYMFYCQANREIVKKANPSLTFADLGKMLGENWKSLSESERKPYDKQHNADKERYEREKAENPDADTGGKKAKKSTKAKKADKPAGLPKRPLTSYMLFSVAERKSMKEAGEATDFAETAAVVGAKWKKMTDDDKAPWNDKAKEAKEKYEEEVKDWEAKNGPIPKAERKKKEGAPKKKSKAKKAATDDDDGGDAGGDDDDAGDD